MAEVIGTQRNNAEGVPHQDGRLVSENSGQFGVSDERRSELNRLENEAGSAEDSGSLARQASEAARKKTVDADGQKVSGEDLGLQTEPENASRNQY